MDKVKIISFIKRNKGAEIAELQKQFDISYKAAKEVIDELISNGDLVYAEGVKYNYVDNVEKSREGQRTEIFKSTHSSGQEEVNEPSKYPSLRAYFEARRREIEQHDDDDEDDEDEDDDDDEIDEEELRKKALKLCIEKGTASVSMFQRAFPIGYLRACKLVDWMEEQGYITSQSNPWNRKVLITEEEYEELYLHDLFEDDEEDFDDDETPSELDNFMHFIDEEIASINPEDQKPELPSLDNIFNKFTERKKASICAGVIPEHDLWDNDEEFKAAVSERMKALIKTNKKMGRHGAVKKAEAYLEAVKDTNDRKMVQVYERLAYELKNMSDYVYGQLKKKYCED